MFNSLQLTQFSQSIKLIFSVLLLSLFFNSLLRLSPLYTYYVLQSLLFVLNLFVSLVVLFLQVHHPTLQRFGFNVNMTTLSSAILQSMAQSYEVRVYDNAVNRWKYQLFSVFDLHIAK
jgi:hypothetical protein